MSYRPASLALLVALGLSACSEPASTPPVEEQDSVAEAEAEADEPTERERMLRIMSPDEADALEGERGLRLRTDAAFDGLTLFTPINSTVVQLIDLAGEVVHSWDTGMAPGAWCYLLDDGSLLHCGRDDDGEPSFRGGGIGGVIRRLAPDGSVLWSHTIADESRHQHHDVEPMPNGNVLVTLWERKSAEEAIARGRHPAGVGAAGMWPDAVIELAPSGTDGAEIVWEWHAWDHLVQDADPKKPNFGSIADHPGRIDVNTGFEPPDEVSEEERQAQEEAERQMAAMGYAGGADDEPEETPKTDAEEAPRDNPFDRSGDWLHTNSVAYQPELDLIVLSSPELGEILVIDHSTTTAEARTSSGGRYGKGGDLLWRWGNPRSHGAGVEADQRLFYQHDPTWIGTADAPRILVFNNGGRRPSGLSFSEALELELPFDRETGFTCPPRAACGPAEPAWSYADPERFYSGFISGAQRLPNGNTLLCSGAGGRLFEVTREGEVVWDYLNPFGGDVEPQDHAGRAPRLSVFRAVRLAHDDPGVLALLSR